MRTITIGLLATLCGFAVALKADTAKAAGCSWGYYTCSTTLEQYDYDSVGCGPYTKPQALSICQSSCTGGTCIDSGWFSLSR